MLPMSLVSAANLRKKSTSVYNNNNNNNNNDNNNNNNNNDNDNDNKFVAKHVKYPLKGNFLGKESREKIGFPHFPSY